MTQVGDQTRIPASFIRGGTSKAIFFRREHLPERQEDWVPIFLAAQGSPDPNGRQLNGMGGGISSLSKICVVGRSARPGVDIDYTFAQVSIRDSSVSFAGNCGNITSAVGPYAVDEGLVAASDGPVTVALFNTNTSKRVDAKFQVIGGRAAVVGDTVIPGVAGSGSPVQLEFINPGGAGTGKLLPTGALVDTFEITGHGAVRASVVDAANLCCFVHAEDLGLTGIEMPEALDQATALHAALAEIGVQVLSRIGAEGSNRLRLIGFVSPAQAATTLSGDPVAAEDANFTARMFSSGQPHRALPLTSALCMAVASRIEGTTVKAVARGVTGQATRIATPSGVLTVAASVTGDGLASVAEGASVFRTQRRLFDGGVYIPTQGA